MRWVLALVLLILLPRVAVADGKLYSTRTALAANVTIPDQRALIHFANGTERLVIETRFTAAGTNFAWVVPLPSPPAIEEASAGLFPTLQYLFQPRIVHNVPRYYVGIVVALGLLCGFWLLVRHTSSVLAGVLIFVLLLLLAAVLFPLSTANSRAGGTSAATKDSISILDRKLVGVFETTTIASREPKAVQTWLDENGFVISTNSEPVIASYVKDGWVFVTARIVRDQPGRETSTPHPLSFTFKTDKPVYPMRLTGVDNGPLQVDLYVFGPSRARASHFTTKRCTRPDYPAAPAPDSSFSNWPRRSPETPSIAHPLLRKWVDGSPVATKLTATLSPENMRQDVWLAWVPFSETNHRLFSSLGARTYSLNLACGVLAIGLAALFVFSARNKIRKRWLPDLSAGLLGMCIVLAGLTYVVLPKTEVRLTSSPAAMTLSNLSTLHVWLRDARPITTDGVRSEARHLIANPPGKDFGNDLLGGIIREEDSPGNFTLREVGDELEFVTYDAQGAEHVLESWALQRQP